MLLVPRFLVCFLSLVPSFLVHFGFSLPLADLGCLAFPSSLFRRNTSHVQKDEEEWWVRRFTSMLARKERGQTPEVLESRCIYIFSCKLPKPRRKRGRRRPMHAEIAGARSVGSRCLAKSSRPPFKVAWERVWVTFGEESSLTCPQAQPVALLGYRRVL